MFRKQMWLPASLLVLGLAGCASVPADWGRGDVNQLAAERLRTRPATGDTKAFTDAALQTPLTVDSAIQLALLNNPGLRRETASLGFAAAEVYDAGRLANPVFSASRLALNGNPAGQAAQLTLGVAFNFVNLLFLPTNERFAKAQFEAAKLSVASASVNLATEVETAWYNAVGADQLAQMREAATRAQRASAELAQRYFNAGNISPRELAMEQAEASQATLMAISAKAKALEARTALNRLMGLNAAQDRWTLDARLAEPLQKEDSVADLQELALRNRLDIESLRQNAKALADRYGFTRNTRLINGLEVGVQRERDFDRAISFGPTLSMELPLFNWGGGRTASARAALEQIEAELDERVLEASNSVKLAAASVEAAKSLAALYKTSLVPQREAIVSEAQKEQNYMLIGVFDVILAKQQEYDAYAGYIEAVRDYWVSRTELARAVGRALPSNQQIAAPTIDPAQILAPPAAPAAHDHSSMKSMEMGEMSHDARSSAEKPANDHSAHSKSNAGRAMPDMPAMDHSQHGKSESGHSMANMPGMKSEGHAHQDAGRPMGNMPEMQHDEAPGSEGSDVAKVCADAATHPDVTVRKAIAAQCKERSSSSSPHAGHAMPATAEPENGHAH